MISAQELLDNGYTKFHDSSEEYKMADWYQASYQKRVKDATGTRYFITISHNIMPERFARNDIERQSFTPSNQFKRNELTFNVQMLYHNETLAEIEQFFHDLWTNMGLAYYDV